MGAEKGLPQNIEAEASVLGCILIDPAALAGVANTLEPGDLYLEGHREVYSAMLDLWKRRQPADLMTVIDELSRRNVLDLIGGSAFVSSLTNQVPTSVNVEHYARIVERCAVLRRLIEAAAEIAGLAYSEPDADNAAETAQAILMGAVLRRGGMDSMAFGDAIDDFLAQCADAVERGVAPGVMTGFTALDDHLLGILPGELVYLCGRPGSGKSAVAAAMAATVATTHIDGTCVEWVSLEMNHVQQVKRLVTSWSGVNGRAIRAGFRLGDGQVDEVSYRRTRDQAENLRRVLGRSLRLYDRPLTMAQLSAHLRRAHAKRGVTLAVVDYLGLLDGEDMRASDYQRISRMSRELKQLALDLNIPIICLLQLNRECEKRADKRPMLSDLRDSGGLEQDADAVIAIYRGAYYNTQRAASDEQFRQFAEMLVLKAREGVANVSIPFRFESEYTRPSDWPDMWRGVVATYQGMKADGQEGGE